MHLYTYTWIPLSTLFLYPRPKPELGCRWLRGTSRAYILLIKQNQPLPVLFSLFDSSTRPVWARSARSPSYIPSGLQELVRRKRGPCWCSAMALTRRGQLNQWVLMTFMALACVTTPSLTSVMLAFWGEKNRTGKRLFPRVVKWLYGCDPCPPCR